MLDSQVSKPTFQTPRTFSLTLATHQYLGPVWEPGPHSSPASPGVAGSQGSAFLALGLFSLGKLKNNVALSIQGCTGMRVTSPVGEMVKHILERQGRNCCDDWVRSTARDLTCSGDSPLSGWPVLLSKTPLAI